MKSKYWIEDSLYQQIKESIPIVCIDCVIQYEDSILLVQRAEEPAKNEWWIIGGRLYLNESFEDCAIRKCKEEVGLNVEILRQLCVINEIFDSIHTIGIIYHVIAKSRNVVIDSTINDYLWFRLHMYQAYELQLNPYVRKSLSFIDKET